MTVNRQIILVPGIMGTQLREGKSTIWPWVYINNLENVFGRAYYKLDLNKNLYDIKPSIIEPFVYSTLEKELKKLGEVTTFPYDWRKSNLDQLALLRGEINEDADEIIFVAHSMGGIITKLFLNYYNEEGFIGKVKKVITLGTPWKGAPYAYKAIKYGIGVPSDKRQAILSMKDSKKLSPSFSSVYQLLPNESYLDEYLSKEGISPIEVDGVLVTEWADLLKEHYLPCFFDNHQDFDQIYATFQDLLKGDFYVEHHEIIGYGKQTLCTIKENRLREPEGLFANGDETVPVLSAMSNPQHQYFVKSKHNALPKNKEVLSVVKNIISGTTTTDIKRVYYSYQEIQDFAFTGMAIKVACPVLVSLTDTKGNIIYGHAGILDEDDLQAFLANQNFDVTVIGNTTYILLPEDSDLDHEEAEQEDSQDQTFKDQLEDSQEQHNVQDGTSLVAQKNKKPQFNKISIEAYDEGPTSVSIEKYEKGKVKVITSYKTFAITENINAELTISPDLDESELILYEEGKGANAVERVTVIVEEKKEIVLPETKFNIRADEILISQINGDPVHVVSGSVFLEILDIKAGSNPVTGTYYALNEEKEFQLVSNEDTVELKLRNGENYLKIFSRDIFGNVEEIPPQSIYYIENPFPQVVFKMYPHQYVVEYNNDHNIDVYETLKLPTPEQKVKFKEHEGQQKDEVVGSNVFYLNKENVREFTIEQTTSFGLKREISGAVEEHALKRLFQGTGEAGNLNELINLIGINKPFKVEIKKPNSKKPATTITDRHVQEGTRIMVWNDNIKLEIVKENKFIPSLQEYNQDMIIEKLDQYPVKLKVIHKETGDDVRSLNLAAFLFMQIEEQSYESPEVKLVFDQDIDAYKGIFDLKGLRNFLDQFWKRDLQNIDIVIKDLEFDKEIGRQTIKMR